MKDKFDKYIRFKNSYKVIKTSLSSILKYPHTQKIINNAVSRMNKIFMHTLNFIKLYYLYNYEKNIAVNINKKLINTIMKILCVRNNRGRKSNNIIPQKTYLLNFYNNVYKRIMCNESLTYTNLNTVMDYLTVTIETIYSNHISEHFSDMINKYINNILYVDDKKKELKGNIEEQYLNMIRKLKKDILNNTNKCNKKYDIIKTNIRNLVPQKYLLTKSLMYHVKAKPLDFLPMLIRLSTNLEKNNHKPINCFPLRKNIIPKYIPLDTTTIIHLLFDKKLDRKMIRNEYLRNGNTKRKASTIWKFLFKTDNRCFKKKGYTFNNMIYTDGYGCSILLIRNDLYNPNNKIQIRTIKKPNGYNDYKYISNISNKERNKLDKYSVVGIDPGKEDLIYATNGNVKIIKKQKGDKIIKKHKPTTFRYKSTQI